MSARVRYLVGPYNGEWLARCGGKVIAKGETKERVVKVAASRARVGWKQRGELAELVIQGKDGRIVDTRTYGRDPRRTPG